MTFEEALRTELITIEELNKKVFPLTAVEGTEAPYLIYVCSRGQNDKALDGFQRSKSVSVEINVIHERASRMRALARQVKALVMSMEKRRMGGKNLTYNDLKQYTYEELKQFTYRQLGKDLWEYIPLGVFNVDDVNKQRNSIKPKPLAETGPYIEEIVFENEGTELYEHEVDLYRCVFDLTFYFEEEE